MWLASNRMIHQERLGKDTILLHLADHDPSGINMSTDIQNRFEIFNSSAVVKRIALNLSQVKKYNPPPNFAKQTDSRFRDYESLYGTQSWELDALEPKVIDKLITEEVRNLTDDALLKVEQRKQYEERQELDNIANSL